ncbi:MAG: hypothetical protein CL572_06130 [Alphaproteobacteria bacterium]|jgi:hypothetical protein|nr:hypothetical protein [Alphaproteobacteria bacterium]
MTKGLLKSMFLHTGILMMFVYGAEIFKKNKRFEIYEIPLDIVDISEKTVNKTQIKKKAISQKNKKQKETYSPPSPKSKPKPPEFAIKEKEKKTPVKNKAKKKVVKKEEKQRLDSILKSIEKIKSQRKVEKKIDQKNEDELVEDKEEDLKEISLGEKLTISEKDAIRRQFYRCWIVPAGAKNLKDLFVSIKIKLDRDGNVISSKLINDNRLNESFFRAAAESAIRAVNHPECKKLKVPEKKYKTWKEIILDFDPSQSIN